MKKITLLAFLAFAAFSNNANAQTSSNTNTTAGAVLIKAMVLSQTAPLHFGSNVLTSAAGGTVLLPSNSTTRVYTGGVATSAATPTATNAAYTVTGTGLETYALTLPTTTVVTHTSVNTGTFTMNITDMKARFSGASADAVTSALNAAGDDSFTLGGTLTVKPSQEGGVYAGTFNVSIDYN